MSRRRRASPAGTAQPNQRRVVSQGAVPSVEPGGRNRYVDLVRLVAILVVVVGHWLDTTIIVVRGQPVGQSALAVVGYFRWLTLLLQVMPMFFVAGGYAAAASWPSWRARGGRWPGWTHGRLVRLLRPTSWFVAIMACLAAVACLLGVDPVLLGQAGWGVALQLWFLPVYLLLIVLAVPMLGAWCRAGWLVLATGVALVVAVDVLMRVGHVMAAGPVSYLLAPGAGFVLGIAWHAGALARRWVPIALLAGGGLALLVLVALFDYPPWMIGVPGEPTSNTGPPNLALLAYSAAQIGIVLLVEAPVQHWLARPRVWAVVVRGNGVVMSLYLWHMVPVVILAALAHATGLLPGPRAGSLPWWGLRVFWIGALALVLAGVVWLVGRFERARPPRLGRAGFAASTLLLVCAVLTGYALSRLAVGGFAPAGHVAVGALAIYATGMLALWLAGRAGDRSGSP
ncbi:MAG: acyltransferase [Candidatus Nanopelagicales bacterium]